MGEEEGLALIFGHAADELPAHQRLQLSVLVDGTVDAHQQPCGVQRGQMLVQITRGIGGCACVVAHVLFPFGAAQAA